MVGMKRVESRPEHLAAREPLIDVPRDAYEIDDLLGDKAEQPVRRMVHREEQEFLSELRFDEPTNVYVAVSFPDRQLGARMSCPRKRIRRTLWVFEQATGAYYV